MNRFFSVLLLVAVTLFVVAPVSGKSRGLAPLVPLLWEVRGEADSRVLLLGSFHLLKEEDYPLPRDVVQAIEHADRVVFELHPDEMTSPALATALMHSAVRRDGMRLQQTLTPLQWERVVQWSQASGMPLASLQGLQGWFVALNASLQGLASAGMRAELGLDRHLMSEAVLRGIPVEGLEAGREQIALFQSLDSEAQAQMLDEALEDLQSGGLKVRALHAAWRTADEVALWSQTGEPMRRHTPALYKALNAERNQRWLEKMPGWLSAGQGTTLMVVGALHLLEQDGLVEQLRAKNHEIQRICSVDGCPRSGKKLKRR